MQVTVMQAWNYEENGNDGDLMATHIFEGALSDADMVGVASAYAKKNGFERAELRIDASKNRYVELFGTKNSLDSYDTLVFETRTPQTAQSWWAEKSK